MPKENHRPYHDSTIDVSDINENTLVFVYDTLEDALVALEDGDEDSTEEYKDLEEGYDCLITLSDGSVLKRFRG